MVVFNPLRSGLICNFDESRESARCGVLVASLRRGFCIHTFFIYI